MEALTQERKKALKDLTQKGSVVLFMKGTKESPRCGFSSKVVQILNYLNVDFVDFDVLEDVDLREEMKLFSDWATFPQLYVDGAFVGGCDIVTEMFQDGDLENLLKKERQVQ